LRRQLGIIHFERDISASVARAKLLLAAQE